jgi:hypothetical protein
MKPPNALTGIALFLIPLVQQVAHKFRRHDNNNHGSRDEAQDVVTHFAKPGGGVGAPVARREAQVRYVLLSAARHTRQGRMPDLGALPWEFGVYLHCSALTCFFSLR